MDPSTNQDDRRPGEWPPGLRTTTVPPTFLNAPDEPASRAGIPGEARYQISIGYIAAHIELQPDRYAATEQAIRDLREAVNNLPGGDK
jgi:hypothetical protein